MRHRANVRSRPNIASRKCWELVENAAAANQLAPRPSRAKGSSSKSPPSAGSSKDPIGPDVDRTSISVPPTRCVFELVAMIITDHSREAGPTERQIRSDGRHDNQRAVHEHRPALTLTSCECSFRHQLVSNILTLDRVLVYPFFGTGAVNVTRGDLKRLDPGQYLNDTIIEFGLKSVHSCPPMTLR